VVLANSARSASLGGQKKQKSAEKNERKGGEITREQAPTLQRGKKPRLFAVSQKSTGTERKKHPLQAMRNVRKENTSNLGAKKRGRGGGREDVFLAKGGMLVEGETLLGCQIRRGGEAK